MYLRLFPTTEESGTLASIFYPKVKKINIFLLGIIPGLDDCRPRADAFRPRLREGSGYGDGDAKKGCEDPGCVPIVGRPRGGRCRNGLPLALRDG